MIEKDLMTQTFGLEIGNFSITPYTIKYHGDHYLKQAEKERIEKEEEHQRLQKVAEKLDTDLTLAKWQKKAFWWVFFLGGVGGTCGIISLCIKIAEYLNSH